MRRTLLRLGSKKINIFIALAGFSTAASGQQSLTSQNPVDFKKNDKNELFATILIDDALITPELCQNLMGAVEGGKSPWGWSLAHVKACLPLSKIRSQMESLFDWQLILKNDSGILQISLCRANTKPSSDAKVCFAGFKIENIKDMRSTLADREILTLVSAGLLEQVPFFMNNAKLNPRRIRVDKRLPAELQKSLKALPVEPEFSEVTQEIKVNPVPADQEKTAFMSFALAGPVRRAIYEKHIQARVKRLSPPTEETAVEAIAWTPPIQQKIEVKDESPLKFDIELANDIFSKETCHIFHSLLDVGVGPWFLKLGDFASCRQRVETTLPANDLNRWKILLELVSDNLEVALCRPTKLNSEDSFSCYSEFKVKSAKGFQSALRDVRFVNVLLGTIYELAPISAYGLLDSPPGAKDKRFSENLSEPLKFRPMELSYSGGGQFYRLIEIRKPQKAARLGTKVFWSKLKTAKPRADKLIAELERLVEETNSTTVPSINSTEPVKTPTAAPITTPEPTKTPTAAPVTTPEPAKTPTAAPITTPEPTKTPTPAPIVLTPQTDVAELERQKASAAAARARETARVAAEAARQAALQAAAAKNLAAARELAAREAAKREAAAQAAVAKEAATREKAAREAALEQAKQVQKDAAIKEAVTKAAAAREAAQRAEAAARAAMAAAKLVAPKDDVEILEEQIPSAEDLIASQNRQVVKISLSGLPVQESFRQKVPSYFGVGFDSGLWGDDTFRIGLWADFSRVNYAQEFKPDVTPDDVEDPSDVAKQTATGERSEASLGLSLSSAAEFDNRLVGLSARFGTSNYSSHLTYDKTLLVTPLSQADGTATYSGALFSTAPYSILGGFIMDAGAGVLSGNRLSGNIYSTDFGWRFLNYSGQPARKRARAKFDFTLGGQLQFLKTKNPVDNSSESMKAHRFGLGFRLTLL